MTNYTTHDYSARADELRTEARQLIDANGDGLTGDQLTRFENLEHQIKELEERDRKAQALLAQVNAGNTYVESTETMHRHLMKRDPYALPTGPESAHDVRSRALSAVEQWNADHKIKEAATRTIERAGLDHGDPTEEVRGVAGHILRYSQPHYIAAFRKYTRDPETYVADLSPDERRAWAEAREYQRATLGTSGAVLPSPLDPSIVLTNDGATDPIRSRARVDTTVSTHKRYITSAGSTFSYDTENAEVSDDTHTEAEVTINVHKGQGWIEATLEAAMDQPQFESEVANIIADGKMRLEADKFINGSGTNEPEGIVTALTGTTSEVNAAGEAIAADDVYGLLEALPPRFRERARWQLELSTRNFLHRLNNPTGTEPALIEYEQLIGRPFDLNSSIDPYSDVDPAATATHRPLVVADWREFVVLDRVGTSVYYVGPGILNGASGRPDGRVGWYATWRSGSGLLTASAARMLKVTTTA